MAYEERDTGNLGKKVFDFIRSYFKRLGGTLDRLNIYYKGPVLLDIFKTISDLDYFSWETSLNLSTEHSGMKLKDADGDEEKGKKQS